MRGSRLERMLFLNFAIHAIAMVSIATLLVPALPGGSAPDDAARILRIAEHPWLFRLGWLPWHLCALVDLLFAVALLRTDYVPRLPAALVMVVTIFAVIPDQGAQLLWITRGVDLAQKAVSSGDLSAYLAFERVTFFYGSGVAPCLYTLASLGWTWCFVAAGTWSRALGWFSVLTWTVFAVISAAPVLPESLRPSSAFVAVGNASAFVLLEIWLFWVFELVLRRSRAIAKSGALALWRHPVRGPIGWSLDLVANSRAVRAVCEILPTMAFRSDITDVVYVNYIVEADKLEPLVPAGLELQRLGLGEAKGRYALFTFLTYRHGHFGPSLLGPLRKLFPSPVHSNWRIHVIDPRTKKAGIHFVTNAIASTLLSLGARLMSEGMPMHVFRRASIDRTNSGAIRVSLDPGNGSAPDAAIDLRPSERPSLDGAFRACFEDWSAFLAYCVPQDRAMSTQPWSKRVTRQEIDLGIPLDACEPLSGKVESKAAQAIAGNAVPLCFRVASVSFRFDGEEHDPLT